MAIFTNVSIEERANVYFNGNVTSRTLLLKDGSKKTLGIMLPGDYEFATNVKEEMKIVSGHLEYKLSGDVWKTIDGSGVFNVPANETFQVRAHSVIDYCCSYE